MLLSILLFAISPSAHAEDPPATAAAAEEDAAPRGGPTTYKIDPKASQLYVIVYNDQTALASRFAHDHAISATNFTAMVTWDPAAVETCNVRFEVPVVDLYPDPPGYRELAKLDPDQAVGDGAKQQIIQNFRSKRQLFLDQFPTITYQSVSCTPKGDTVIVTGDLVIRGNSKRVTLPMKIDATPDRFKASGRVTLLHSDFGMDPFANVGGMVRNKPELVFVVNVNGSPVTP